MPARRIIAAFLVLLTLSIGIAYAGDEGLKVIFIDVGQGDTALLQCDGEAMMIDTGLAVRVQIIPGFPCRFLV